MKYFSGILKQFTPAQRLVVLVLLLIFTSLSLVLSQYFKTDDCRPLIEENIKMHSDFAKISEMLRKQRLEKEGILDQVVILDSSKGPQVEHLPPTKFDKTMDEILSIANSHSK